VSRRAVVMLESRMPRLTVDTIYLVFYYKDLVVL